MSAREIVYPPLPSLQMQCRLCQTMASFVFRQKVLGEWDASYYQCPHCDLIQTSKPLWIKSAYSSAIAAMDTGAIERNRLTAQLTSAVAWILGINAETPCLDYGGGNGVFVRTMRDRGFNYWLYDRYAQNIFARGFDGDPRRRFPLVTAFEVFEHLVDVDRELKTIFSSRPGIVLISTQRHRGPDQNWWYYSAETGQHVAFYSARTMQHIADRFGYIVGGARAYTLFISREAYIAPWRIRLAQRLVTTSRGNVTSPWVRAVLKFGPRFPSRILSDNEHIRLASNQAA